MGVTAPPPVAVTIVDAATRGWRPMQSRQRGGCAGRSAAGARGEARRRPPSACGAATGGGRGDPARRRDGGGAADTAPSGGDASERSMAFRQSCTQLDRVFKLSGLLSMPKATRVVEKLASAYDLGKMLTISNQITC